MTTAPGPSGRAPHTGMALPALVHALLTAGWEAPRPGGRPGCLPPWTTRVSAGG